MKWFEGFMLAIVCFLSISVGMLWGRVNDLEREVPISEGTINNTALEEAGYISANGDGLEQGDNFTIEIEGWIDTK